MDPVYKRQFEFYNTLKPQLVCSNQYHAVKNLHSDIDYNLENWSLEDDKYENRTDKSIDKSNQNFFQHKKQNYNLFNNNKMINKYIQTKAKPNKIFYNDYKRYAKDLNFKDDEYLNTKIYHLGDDKDIENAHYNYLERVHNMNKKIIDDMDENVFLLSKSIDYSKYYNPRGYEVYNYTM